MIIRKLEIGYGGVLTSNYEIVKNGHELVYRFGQHFAGNEVTRVPGHHEWNEFARAVTPIIKTWKKEYYNESRNGIQWRVSIETSEGYFYSCGSNEFPEDFQSFLYHCRNIIRRSDFANDYRPSLTPPPAPVNSFNRRIVRLLKEQRKTIHQLAGFLAYDVHIVKDQLRSMETFPYEDLMRMCNFFNELPSDFLFETAPESFSRIERTDGTSALVRHRIQETQKQIIEHFDKTFIAN